MKEVVNYSGTNYVNVIYEDPLRAAGSTVRLRGPPDVTAAGHGGTNPAEIKKYRNY